MNPSPPASPPVAEAELHALVDGQLTPERRAEVESYLAGRAEEAARVASYRQHKRELRALFDPVLDEALSPRLARAARPRTPWHRQPLAAGIAIAVISGAAGWGLRASLGPAPSAQRPPPAAALASASGFAQRAAVAHAVYSPDLRRAVEVGADQEEQLVTWLSKRMGTPMKPPQLQALGYALEGGRLLPGGQGPVAQFMYRDPAGARLTLYVSPETATAAPGRSGAGPQETAFRFAQQGQVNVFYWIDAPFGYAISASAGRSELARVSAEVYRQLAAGR